MANYSERTDLLEGSREKELQTLRESKATLLAALASMADAVFIVDKDGQFIDFNEAFVKYHRFKTRDDCSKKFSDCAKILEVWFTESGKPAPPEMWAIPRALRGEDATNVEYTLHRKDTGETWIGSYNFAPIRKDGEIIGAVVTARDITEAKQQKETLKKNEEKYHHLLQYAPTAIFEIDYKVLRFKSVNDAVSLLSGYSQEELLSMNPMDLLDEESKVRFKERINKALSGQKIDENVDYKVIKKDGTKISTMLHVKPTFTNGKIDGALVVGYDITRRKMIEEALRASEEKFRSVLETSRDVIVRVNLQTNSYEFVSPSVKDLVGYPPDEFTHMKSQEALEMIHPNDRAVLNAARIKADETGKAESEYRQQHKDGHFIWVSNRMSVIYDDRGRPLYRVSSIHDITERKQFEEALRLQAQLIDLSPDAIIVRSLEGKISFWSKGAEKLYGWTNSQAVGQITHSLFKTMFPEPLEHIILKVINEGSWTGELTHQAMNGRSLILQSYWLARYDSNGNIRDILESNIDITARKKIENNLLQKTKELTLSNKELESFSYSIAHDLRAPLRSINGYSHILCEDYGNTLEAGGERLLEKIQQSSQMMGELIDAILGLAKISRVEMKMETVNISRLAESITRRLQETNRDRKIEFHISNDLMTNGDRSLIEILLNNLLENAWKFTNKSPHPVITIGKEKVKGESMFYVQDNGAGFNPTYAEKLFKPFERLHGAEFLGTGVGLASAQRIIQRHGGKIWAKGEVGKGATFYFTLSR